MRTHVAWKYGSWLQPSLVLWTGVTVLFLYERTYLIQKAGLPHWLECTVARVGLLLLLCYSHQHVLVPRLRAQGRHGLYAGATAAAVGVYLLLQGSYDQYLFGFVIGDQKRAGWARNLPYNALVTAWYLLLTQLIAYARQRQHTPQAVTAPPLTAELPAAATEELLVFKTGGEWVRLPIADLYYAQGVKDYTQLYTRQGKYLVKGSVGTVASWLPPGQFIRIHKSYVVAHQHLQAVAATEVTVAGEQLPLGRTYAVTVLEAFRGAVRRT